mmetsp:Transcript_116756/g.330293  ORF Transcript_116756/g.330293 Transcript_116756/m.330293 type:complete len:449 (+) Transcript_116756:100-1446(+)
MDTAPAVVGCQRIRSQSSETNGSVGSPTFRAFRVLTLNLCMTSPGLGNLRFTVKLGVSGFICCMAVYGALVLSGWLPTGVGCALLVYGVAGSVWAKGFSTVVTLPFTLAALGVSRSLLRAGHSATFLLLAGWGFAAFTYSAFAQLSACLLALVRPDLARSYSKERIELLMHHLKESGPYDIVCIQEATIVWGRVGLLRQLEEGAAALGLRYAVWSSRWPRIPAVFCTNGLGLLSHYPIDQASVRNLSFREQSSVEWPSLQRGALFASVQIPGARRVDVLTLHNTSSVESLSGGCGAQCNGNSLGGRQVLEAVEWFHSLSPPASSSNVHEEEPLAAPTVLRLFTGDFNNEKNTIPFKYMAAVASDRCGLVDAVPDSEATFGCIEEDGGPSEWLLTFPVDRCRPRTLDHIFADRPAICSRVVPMRNEQLGTRHLYQQVSDHRGVEALFEI